MQMENGNERFSFEYSHTMITECQKNKELLINIELFRGLFWFIIPSIVSI